MISRAAAWDSDVRAGVGFGSADSSITGANVEICAPTRAKRVGQAGRGDFIAIGNACMQFFELGKALPAGPRTRKDRAGAVGVPGLPSDFLELGAIRGLLAQSGKLQRIAAALIEIACILESCSQVGRCTVGNPGPCCAKGFRGFVVPAFTQQAFELFAQIARMRGDGVCIATFDAHGLRALGSEAVDGLVRLARAFADAFKLCSSPIRPSAARRRNRRRQSRDQERMACVRPAAMRSGAIRFRCIERDVLKQLLLILAARSRRGGDRHKGALAWVPESSSSNSAVLRDLRTAGSVSM